MYRAVVRFLLLCRRRRGTSLRLWRKFCLTHSQSVVVPSISLYRLFSSFVCLLSSLLSGSAVLS